MDWHAEDKLTGWDFFTTRMRLYYSITHTLKNQLSAEDQKKPDKVFTAFANNFERSSSHWQARDEYLSNIKQGKQQTMSELDINIKDLVRRCQFPH